MTRLLAALLLLLAAAPAAAQDRALLPGRPQAAPIVGGVPFAIRFAGPVRGLVPGAPVEIRGLRVGAVRTIDLAYDPARTALSVIVGIELAPALLPTHPASPAEATAALETLVRAGLRASLATTTPLGGDTIIDLDIRPGAAPATLDRTATPPEIPAAPSAAERLAERLPALLDKLGQAPIDQMLADLAAAMAGLNALANGPELRDTLASLRKSAEDLNGFVARLDTRLTPVLAAATRTADRAGAALASVERTLGERSPLVAGLNNALREVSGAVRNLRLLAEYLERHPEALITGKKEIRP
jgi:paraquat-inducible protein B